MPTKAARASRESGVKTPVSTGAMFSITLCFASTSQATTTTAPTRRRAAPTLDDRLRVDPDSLEHSHRKAVSTTPPNAISA